MRSGTLQYLHVSEFGKICAQYPEKAREIVTGALNTVEAGQFIVIESTAEGQEGAFYRMCQEAREHAAIGQAAHRRSTGSSTSSPGGRTRPTRSTTPTSRSARSTSATSSGWRHEGITLSRAQKAWYVKKDQTLGGDMRREYPSTPDEAFEQALEGAYFAHQLAAAAKQGRIGGFPLDPRNAGQHLLGSRPQRPERHLAAPVRRRATTASSATTRTAASSSATMSPG